MTGPNYDQPLANRMLEDYLAHGATEADHSIMLSALITLSAEYMARAAGRRYTIDSLANTTRFIKEARPSRPWKP